jgi:CYTH domain-containing protein
MRRLGRKADVDAATRLITSIYLTQAEFGLLADLPGRTLRKVRHHLVPMNGVEIAVDVFEDALAGLILVEAEFSSAEAMAAFRGPHFALREVTQDGRYGGGALAVDGPPG